MRLGTCVALELALGTALIASVGVSAGYGVRAFQAQWAREARAAEIGPRDPSIQAAMTADRSAAGTAYAAGEPPGRSAHAVRDDVGSQAPLGSLEPTAQGGADLGETNPQATAITAAATGQAPPSAGNADGARIAPIPAADTVETVEGHRHPDLFHGVRDDLLLEPLRNASIKRVRYNRGGSSISLRIDFDNGARAAFKPDQAARQTIPRKEIAAFRIDRLLGLRAVPPAIGRALPMRDILAAVDTNSQAFLPRLEGEMFTDENGAVTGELSWWIPVIRHAQIAGYDVDSTNGIVTWKRYLMASNSIPEKERHMAAQISSMVLFDFLINNPDRWSGANVRMSQDGRVLYFMDNTMSFGLDPEGHRKSRTYFTRSQKFSRSLVVALRNLSAESLDDVLDHDTGPFEHLLSQEECAAVLARRDWALTYIDDLIAQHGESVILAFP